MGKKSRGRAAERSKQCVNEYDRDEYDNDVLKPIKLSKDNNSRLLLIEYTPEESTALVYAQPINHSKLY